MRRSLIIPAVNGLSCRSQGFKFACEKDRGAVLIINSEARRKDSEQRGAFEKYMREHYKSWLNFANSPPNSRGIWLSDILFVTGACTQLNKELTNRCHFRSRSYRGLGCCGIFKKHDVKFVIAFFIKA